MKTFKRQFIESWAGIKFNPVESQFDMMEQALLEAIEKDDEGEKFTDWEYMFKGAVYLSLIGYADSNGHSIPCKVREQIEAAALKRFKKNMKESNYNPPLPNTPKS